MKNLDKAVASLVDARDNQLTDIEIQRIKMHLDVHLNTEGSRVYFMKDPRGKPYNVEGTVAIDIMVGAKTLRADTLGDILGYISDHANDPKRIIALYSIQRRSHIDYEYLFPLNEYDLYTIADRLESEYNLLMKTQYYMRYAEIEINVD